jgi:hypothetical protein
MQGNSNLTQDDNEHLDKRFDQIMEELQKINGAFAKNDDGSVDFSGHRQYHEEMIRAAKAQTEFWRELKLDIAKKGIWGGIIILIGIIVTGLMAKLGLGGPR